MEQEMPNRLKELRENRNLSGTYMAEILGVSAQYFYDLEKGKRRLNETMIKKISIEFGVTADYILGISDDPTPYRFINDPNSNMLVIPPHLRPLFEAVKDLTTEKIDLLIAVAVNMDKGSSSKRVVKIHRKPTLKVIKSNPSPTTYWYIGEIKKGRSLYDTDFLCRLLSENIIKPTVYGRPLTQEQKKGLVKYIESHKSLLLEIKKDASVSEYPELYAAHNEGEESLDLEKESELTALMEASNIILKMMHRYLDEEEKAD